MALVMNVDIDKDNVICLEKKERFTRSTFMLARFVRKEEHVLTSECTQCKHSIAFARIPAILILIFFFFLRSGLYIKFLL